MLKKLEKKRFESTKLFYGKYSCKLAIHNSIATAFRNKNFSFTRSVIDKLQQDFEKGNPLALKKILREIPVKTEHFLNAQMLLHELSGYNEDYGLRVEGVGLSIYSNNLEWLEYLARKCKNIEGIWSPDPKYIDLLKPGIIITKKHTDYKLKVYPKGTANPNFYDWVTKNQGKVKAGKIFLDSVKNGYNLDNLYFYVRDENVLNLIRLFFNKDLSNILKIVNIHAIDK